MKTTTDFNACNGTSFKGHMTADYRELVLLFGQPTNGDGYKVQAEWIILLQDDDGLEHVATIYDWKQGYCYWGIHSESTPVEMVKEWNIGGRSYRAVELLNAYIEEQRELQMEREWQTYSQNGMEGWDMAWLEEGL